MQPGNNNKPKGKIEEKKLQDNFENIDRFAAAKSSTDAAHEVAMHDIELDADLSIHSPNDDLDEGETARLGEKTDLI